MGLIFNGISEFDSVLYNGNAVETILYNDTEVWRRIKPVAVPTLSATTVETDGSSVGPAVKGFDSSIMTQSGTASAGIPGTYTVAWALKDPGKYCWADGTAGVKSAVWKCVAAQMPTCNFNIYTRKAYYAGFSVDLTNSPKLYTGVRVMMFQNFSSVSAIANLDSVSWDTNWYGASDQTVPSTNSSSKYTCLFDTGYSENPSWHPNFDGAAARTGPWYIKYNQGTPEAVTGNKNAFWRNSSSWDGAVFECGFSPTQFWAHVYDGLGESYASPKNPDPIALVIFPYAYLDGKLVRYKTYKLPGPIKVIRQNATAQGWNIIDTIASIAV